jgi:hypothetical protein
LSDQDSNLNRLNSNLEERAVIAVRRHAAGVGLAGIRRAMPGLRIAELEQLGLVARTEVGGVGAAALSFRLLPPLSPAFRTRRLLALTLRDLRRKSVSSPAP